MTSNPNIGQEQALRECPFCGGDAELTGHKAPEFWVRCPAIGCKASTEGFGSKERAIAAWNQRSTPTPAQVEPVDRAEHAFRTGYEAGFEDAGGKGDYSPDTAWEAYP